MSLAGLLLVTLLPAGAVGQARPPLPRTVDSTGVLSAVRAVDVRQVCRCPIVMVDTAVRRSAALKMFSVLEQPVAFRLGKEDVALLAPTRHRAVPAALRSMTAMRRDTAFLAIQLVPTRPPEVRVMVVVAPPEGITVAYLVTLAPRRASWLVQGVQAVYEP
jgi:hypothetical protein